MNEKEEMLLIFNKLSKDSQCYILNMANMAKIAENGALKNILKTNFSKDKHTK